MNDDILNRFIEKLVTQNIDESYKPIPNLKECYEKINWSKILEEQNKVSSDPKDGIIWGLCTCITFVGEYKFFWNIA